MGGDFISDVAGSNLFSDLGSSFGDFAEAGGSKKAAKMYGEAANYADLSGELKGRMIARQAFQTQGSAEAAASSNGFSLSGSTQDILRSNAQQAGLARGINTINTDIQVSGYKAEQSSANAAAEAQQGAGIGSALGAIASVASVAALL